MKYDKPKKMRVMYFDLECKPGHWIGGDYVSKIITAAAWSIGNSKQVTVLTHYDTEPGHIAEAVAAEILAADLVVGHYIRGFDLPLLNGELLRAGAPPLDQVLTHDTKGDLYPAHGRSKSQENLSSLLGIKAEKLKVTLEEWEQFNTKDLRGKAVGIKRVKDDVIQNREMRRALLERGWLGPPRVWQAGGKAAVYVP